MEMNKPARRVDNTNSLNNSITGSSILLNGILNSNEIVTPNHNVGNSLSKVMNDEAQIWPENILNLKPIEEATYADLVLWDGSKKIVVSGDDYSSDLFPTSAYTPIGVVVIPASHNVYGDGLPTMMSLVAMNCNTPESGGSSYQKMKFGDTVLLPELGEAPYIGEGSTIGNTIIGTSAYTYLPSDNFTYPMNPYDEGTGYFSERTSYRQSPSPYVTGGGRNPLYYQTTSPSSTANCLADFDGRGNTDKILVQRGDKDYSSWKPTSNEEADYPAASCCDMFHTPGTNQGDWYLPSAGELGYVIARKKAINTTINKLPSNISKTLVGSPSLWSSTATSDHSMKNLGISSGRLNIYTTDNNYDVRAFSIVQ